MMNKSVVIIPSVVATKVAEAEVVKKTDDETMKALRKIDKRLSEPSLDWGFVLFEASTDALVVADQNGYITSINGIALTLFGYTKEEIMGEQIEVLMMEEDRASHVALREKFTEHPHPVMIDQRAPLRARHKDGSRFDLEIGVTPVTIKDVPFFVARMRRPK